MQKQVEQNSKQQQDKSLVERKKRTRTQRSGQIYERDLTTPEVATMLTFGVGNFVLLSSIASYGMLEFIDYVFREIGATNETLWVLILFALNAVMVLSLSKTLLPRMVKLTYDTHQRFKRILQKN